MALGRVRVATFGDVASIVDFLEDYHNDSNLSDIPFDRTSTRQAVEYHIGMKKHCAYVYSTDKVEGVILGSIEPFLFNKKRNWATDLLFVADKGGAQLLKRFHAWAKAYKVDRIIQGISSGNPRAEELYKLVGMEHVGGMYVIH